MARILLNNKVIRKYTFDPYLPMKFEIEVSSNSYQTITIILSEDYNYDFTIKYGDNTPIKKIRKYNSSSLSHTYSPGTYTSIITIYGYCPWIKLVDKYSIGEIKIKYKKVLDWGYSNLSHIEFYECKYLTTVPTDTKNSFRNLTSCENMFYTCWNLEEIPIGLFYNCVNVTNFNNTFKYCYRVVSGITSGMFDNCVNVKSFDYTFAGFASIITNQSNPLIIPNNLFDYNTGVTSFKGVFSESDIKEIPNNLFDYNINVTTFAEAFWGCVYLNSLSLDIFKYNVNVTTFDHTFASTSLNNSHINLFKYNQKATDFDFTFSGTLYTNPHSFSFNTGATSFYGTFYNCLSLDNVYSSSGSCAGATDMRYCFYGCYKTDNKAYAFWNLPTPPLGTACFRGCRDLLNYTSIPAGWK